MKHIKLLESHGKCTVVKAPNAWPENGQPSIFLAGSIEMGSAQDWQTDITNLLADENINILNPRRDDWDSSWEQTMTNKNFSEQVNWELASLEMATLIILYFDPNTKSPISLLELGLFARDNKLLVCCPDGFYRKGNVDIVCSKYNIPMYNTIEELAGAAIVKINQTYYAAD